MQTRYLGRTDVRLSEIALGTWGLADGAYGEVAEERFEETVRAAWDAGVDTFDLAPLWGRGASERVTARALGKNLGEAVLITRLGQVMSGDKLVGQFDSIALDAAIDQSLERIGRSYIDVVLLHNPPDAALMNDRFARGIGAALASGRIRAWGISTSTLTGARLAMKVGAQAVCLPYNALAPDDVDEITPMLKEAGVGVLARSPLAYGLLGGKVKPGHVFAEGDHRRERWSDAALKARIDRVEEITAFAPNRDVADLSLRYVLQNAFVATALVGARSPEQIRAAAKASVGVPYLDIITYKRILNLPK